MLRATNTNSNLAGIDRDEAVRRKHYPSAQDLDLLAAEELIRSKTASRVLNTQQEEK